MRIMTSLRLKLSGWGDMVNQIWLIIPVPFISAIVLFSPGLKGFVKSLFPPDGSVLETLLLLIPDFIRARSKVAVYIGHRKKRRTTVSQ